MGDWVAVQALPEDGFALVEAVLPRSSLLARRAPGRRTRAQVVAANVDTVFAVTSLNQELSLRRLERYLALVLDAGCRAVVVLSKADLADDLEGTLETVRAVAGEAPVHAVSAVDGPGLEDLEPYLRLGETVALLGSSGVGKSTLVNHWLGEDVQAIRDVRAGDGRGRHTTTRRELLVLPGGALVLDTPGMRELGLWIDEAGLASGFEDVESFAEGCRFRDCEHGSEPSCAVRAALEDGRLDPGRFASWEKLRKESAALEARLGDPVARARRERQTGKLYKRIQAEKRRSRDPGA